MDKVVHLSADHRRERGSAPRPVVVVIDAGNRASLVVLGPELPAVVGTRFHHQGRCWEILGRRPDSRVLVAEPVPASRRGKT